jgi:hypothetical protein
VWETNLDGLSSQFLAVDPPLRPENRLYDVSRFTVIRATSSQQDHPLYQNEGTLGTHVQTGMFIGLSFFSTKRPFSSNFLTTSRRASKRLIPYTHHANRRRSASEQTQGGSERKKKERKETHGKRTGVAVQSAIIVEDIDELELVPHTTFIVVGIVRGSDLDRSRTKRHVDGFAVRDDGNTAVDERVKGEFAVEVLLVIGKKGSEHGQTPR